MLFDNFASANQTMLWATFGIAFIMGAVVNKTNFCTMGAVSDLVNIGDSGRMRAWILAATLAMIGVLVMENMGLEVNLRMQPHISRLVYLNESLYCFHQHGLIIEHGYVPFHNNSVR